MHDWQDWTFETNDFSNLSLEEIADELADREVIHFEAKQILYARIGAATEHDDTLTLLLEPLETIRGQARQAPFEHVAAMSDLWHEPGATSLAVDDGSRRLIVHETAVVSAVRTFIDRHPQRPREPDLSPVRALLRFWMKHKYIPLDWASRSQSAGGLDAGSLSGAWPSITYPSDLVATFSVVEPCSLYRYRRVVEALPRPTDEQVKAFVRFVCEAHSWYKHLPLLPPGEVFRFFVDPYSGYDRVFHRDGILTLAPRDQDSDRFHYTWMTTSEYRSRFGHLAYDAQAGVGFAVGGGGSVREYVERPMFFAAHGPYRLPLEVLEAGSVE